MKKIILIKEGTYHPSLFADFSEFINNDYTTPGNLPFSKEGNPTVLNFFNKSAFTFQLVGNVLSETTNTSIAISHYNNNVANPSSNPTMFSALDLDNLCKFADEYGSIVYGAVQNDPNITSSNVLSYVTILARDPKTCVVKDLLSGSYFTNERTIPIVSFFGLVKIADLPVYYLITDPTVLKAGANLSTSNDDYTTRLITDYDGTIKSNILTPKFSPNVDVLSNNTIYITGQTFSMTLFEGIENVLYCNDIDVSNIMPEIKSNLLTSTMVGGKIFIAIPEDATTGFLKIKVSGGTFLDVVSHTEALTLEYSVIKID